MKEIRRQVRRAEINKPMNIKEFIEKHILPHEDNNLELEYRRGNMDYDMEYLIERATELGIKLNK